MATKTSAIITSVGTDNKAVSKAITDINPNADNGAIKALCESLAGLTNNTLKGVQRIDKTDLDGATTKEKFTVIFNTTSIEGLTFGAKSSGSKPLFYGVDGDKPQLTVEYYFEKADGSTAHIIAPTILFAANWVDSTKNVNVFCDTTGCSTFGITKLIADLHFAETATTAATTYRLTIADGETTTFVQL